MPPSPDFFDDSSFTAPTQGRPPFPGTEHINAAEVFGTPGYCAPHPRLDPLARTAFIVSVLSFIPLVGLVAAVLGGYAVRRLRYTFSSSLSLAWLSVFIGSAATIFYVWLFILLISLY